MLKTWIIDVLIKKFGPSFIRGAILGLAGFIAAKEGLLAHFGVVYDAASHIVTVNLDTLNIGLVALIPAIGGGVIKVLNHHADTAVKTLANKTVQ